MVEAIHRGSSIQKLSKKLSERMDVGYHNAERLVRTELNYIENRAALDAIQEAEMPFYQFVATLDNRTTPMCQSLDGRIFPIEEKNQGENAPPMHVRCRSTVIGTLDDGKSGRIIKGKRAATDENGKRIKIPADMNYNDWKKVYIEKTQTLDDWRKAKDAENKILREKAANSKIRVEGREIIRKLANGEKIVPRESKNSEVKKSLHNELAVIKDNGNRNRYTVNFDLMNSKAYHDKFENLSAHKSVNEALYKQAARILGHRSGTEYEDIAMLDARTGKILVENNSAMGIYKFQCGLTYEQYEELQNYGKEFEILHNHPNSSEPSTSDIIGLFNRELAIASTVVCHDGTVYRMEKLKSFANIEQLVNEVYDDLKKDFAGLPNDIIEYRAVSRVIKILTDEKIMVFKEMKKNG